MWHNLALREQVDQKQHVLLQVHKKAGGEAIIMLGRSVLQQADCRTNRQGRAAHAARLQLPGPCT